MRHDRQFEKRKKKKNALTLAWMKTSIRNNWIVIFRQRARSNWVDRSSFDLTIMFHDARRDRFPSRSMYDRFPRRSSRFFPTTEPPSKPRRALRLLAAREILIETLVAGLFNPRSGRGRAWLWIGSRTSMRREVELNGDSIRWSCTIKDTR